MHSADIDVRMAPNRRVTIEAAALSTGLTPAAIRAKIHKAVWVEGREYFRDPQGMVWVDLQGVNAWVASGLGLRSGKRQSESALSMKASHEKKRSEPAASL